jgi:alpha-tubulin suppressor-like RCC1 family protein
MQFRCIGRLMKTAVSSIATLLILLGALLAIPPSAFAASGSKFSEVAVGIDHSCALTMKGRAYCWGNNDSGQLGDGNYGYDSSSPVAVVGDRRYLHISAGYDATCAISTAGAAYCWGYNDYGQLGNGTHDETISAVSYTHLTLPTID